MSNCMRRQTYAQAKSLHTSSIKCTTLRLYAQAPYAHASRGIAVRSLYQITLCTNCMRRQNPMRRVCGVLAGGHIVSDVGILVIKSLPTCNCFARCSFGVGAPIATS